MPYIDGNNILFGQSILLGNSAIGAEITLDQSNLPEMSGIVGLFNYGGLSGTAWSNEAGDDDFTFSTAPTDTGSEYTLELNSQALYESSNDFSGDFTLYTVLKYASTAGSGNGLLGFGNWQSYRGVEISSGWGSSVHCVRSKDREDYATSVSAASYAVIAVAGSNETAAVFVNGVKVTSSWAYRALQQSGATNGKFVIGRRYNSTYSNKQVSIKMCAMGTTKQTDEQVISNSQFLMTKYGIS